MAKETKVGLLLGLGVVFLFMCILQWRFGGRPHAELGEQQSGNVVAMSEAGRHDALTEQGDTPAAPVEEIAAVTDSGDGNLAGERPLDMTGDGAGQGREYVGNMTTDLDAEPDGMVTPTPEKVVKADELPTPPESIGDPLSPGRTETATYLVKQGDTGAKIAEQVLGRGSKWPEIAKLNPGVDAKRLKVGMKLVVPGKPAEPTLRKLPTTRESESTTVAGTYTVVKGDSLGTISTKMYGTCKKGPQLIAAANKGVNPKVLKVGTKLVIPAVEAAVPAVPAVPAAPAAPSVVTDVDTMMAKRGPAAEPIIGEPALASAETYKVQATDSLYTISKKALGSASRWKEIYELNRDKLPNPKALTVGQELKLPAAKAAVATGTSVAMLDGR